jgi:integrase
MLYLCTAVLDDQVAQGNAVRNVAKLVDRIAGEAGEMRTLTERDMFQILDHECRDRHLWALALYGLRRGEIAGLRWRNVDLKAKTGQDRGEPRRRGRGDHVRNAQIQSQLADSADAR